MTNQLQKFIGKKTEFNKTTDPSVNNDSANGYAVGSRWFNITNDSEYICLDSSNGAAIWREIISVPLVIGNSYSNINSNYSPIVRWIPSGLSGSGAGLTWNSSVGSGTVDARGSSANFVATSVGGKAAFYSNPSSDSDGTKFIRLNLGATYAGTGDFTCAFIVQDFAAGSNGRFITLLDDTPVAGSDFSTTTDISAVSENTGTATLRSFYNNASIAWSPGTAMSTVGTTPALIVLRYTHSTTEWKVWVNNATDFVATTNTIDLGTLSVRNIQFGKWNQSDLAAATLRIAEVIFWDSPLTDGNVANLSTDLLVEYGVRIGVVNLLGRSISHNGTNWRAALKSEYAKTAAPTVDDDADDGYEIGSTWIDITNDKAYVCLDATLDAAVWTDITQSGGFTAGDGIDITLGTISVDLKANGGLVIDTTELALDLGATLMTGTLTAAKGGTGQTSYAIGDLLYASTTTALSKLADIATGNALITGGVSVAPSYGKIGLTTHVTGTLDAASGGTNLTSYAVGDIIYASGTTTLAKLADIATGNALITGGVGVAPTYGKIGLATHVTGTLPVASGGTNLTSYTIGDLIFASGATTLASRADVATGNALISQGVGVAPIYGKIGLTTHISGTLPVASGGTNLTTYTTGDIVYASAATTLARLADIATGNAVISGGVGVAPAYGKIGLTTHTTGTLPVANGGSGTTTLTANGILLGNGTSAVTALKSEFAKTASPLITDDTVAGYAVGSQWIDTTADREFTCLDSTASAAVWKEVVAVPTLFSRYNNLNANYSPTVRWIPSGLSGSGAGLTWNSSVGSGTVGARGSAANFVAASVGGKAAFYSNPSNINDGTKFLRLNLGATYAGSGDFTFAFVVQNFAATGNGRFMSLLNAAVTAGNDNSYFENMSIIQQREATTNFRSYYDNTDITWSPGAAYTTVGATPALLVCRYTHSGTQYKVWVNNATDVVATTTTINLGPLSIRNIQIGLYNLSADAAATLRIAEVIFWDSPLTDQNVTDLSNDILTEYGVRGASFSFINRTPLHNGTNWRAALKSEYAKTTAPTINDDSDAGYEVGSYWFNTTADRGYVCLDATIGASVWKETTKENVSEFNDVNFIFPYTSINALGPMNRWLPSDISLSGTLTWTDTINSSGVISQYGPGLSTTNLTGTNTSPAIQLNSTNAHLALQFTNNITDTSGFTFYIVAQNIVQSSTNRAYVRLLADGSTSNGYSPITDFAALVAFDVVTFRARHNSTNFDFTPTMSFSTFPNVTVLIGRYNSGTFTYILDGIEYTSVNTLNVAFDAGNIAFGGSGALDGNPSVLTLTGITLAEVGVWDSPLSNTNLAKLSVALNKEYRNVLGSYTTNASTSNEGEILKYNGTTWINTMRIRNDATTAPTVTNDSTDNYTVGSLWHDITNDETFVCLDATATTAIWKLVSDPPYLALNQTTATAMSTVTPALSASITTYQLVFSESNTTSSTRYTLDTNTIKINLAGTYRLEADVSMNVGTQTAIRIYRIGFQESTTSATTSFTNINTSASIKIGNIADGAQYIAEHLHHYISISTVPTWIRLVTSLDSYDTATRDVEHGTTFNASFVKL